VNAVLVEILFVVEGPGWCGGLSKREGS
jgi:hypothetical protein